ncbi:MAG: HisA/HisF-related TIM barrel protein, partial [Stellaceae bacterium]
AIIFTDIERDGMMQGANIEQTAALARRLKTPVIASGGISSLEELRVLKAHEGDGIAGAILGRALYDGRVDLAAALAVAG